MSRARSINELEVLAHLMICLAADRSVEKDSADANADIDTGASAPAPPAAGNRCVAASPKARHGVTHSMSLATIRPLS